MPQLETSTWFTTVLASSITLFVLIQMKISLHNFYKNPSNKYLKLHKSTNPWEQKWTKIYSPLSLPQL
uniref:ATP synthase complex subunit 8 n=1 Tax=Cricetulus longicaudatus TaxID=10030 RepID=A0A0U1XEG5_CRILO|nr:ATP synthase F0 subunit 8 [Cricetulus longicaudatus]AIS38957.1 ATPase subunit 8 [Cricetulus longicaudatus]